MQQTIDRPEYTAVRHILSAPLIARRTAPYQLEDDFDWIGLRREAETMSGGEALLVRIAYELWSAEKATGLWELVRRLDRETFRWVIEALWIARGPSSFTPGEEAFVDGRGEELAA